MARRPRIEMAGYHHVVNRGVEQRDIFLEPKDYETFLEIVCSVCLRERVIVHSYCLMTNHYHLLLETKNENLSKVMRTINANYASYFNRKNERVGHLWQGRFKSWFITNDAYLYTLIKYIELNPVKAKMTQTISEYPYCSFQMFSEERETISCVQESVMFEQFLTKKERVAFFDSWYDEDIIQEIQKASNLVVTSMPAPKLKESNLVLLFKENVTKEERNENVMAAIREGYSQQQIAKVLGISQPAVSLIVRKFG